MARAPLNVSHLQIKQRIPQNLSSSDGKFLNVNSVCALSDYEVLLAVDDEVPRVLSLDTEESRPFAARDPISIRNMRRVAFDVHTDTLLLLVNDTNKYKLVTLGRNTSNSSEWFQVERISTDILVTGHRPNIAVCDSRVLIPDWDRHTVYVFDVNAEHNVSVVGSVPDSRDIHKLACFRRDNDTLVAFSHLNSTSLNGLTSSPLSLKELWRVGIINPYELVFYKELLLIADLVNNNQTHKSHNIMSFRVSDSELKENRELLASEVNVYVRAWALAGERLVLWDENSWNLLVYALE